MPSLRAELAADTANAIALYDQTFEWAGNDYPCVNRDQPTEFELQEAGGFIDGVNSAILVAKSAFAGFDKDNPATFPQINDLVNSSKHQVKRCVGHKDDAAAQLILYIGSVDA